MLATNSPRKVLRSPLWVRHFFSACFQLLPKQPPHPISNFAVFGSTQLFSLRVRPQGIQELQISFLQVK